MSRSPATFTRNERLILTTSRQVYQHEELSYSTADASYNVSYNEVRVDSPGAVRFTCRATRTTTAWRACGWAGRRCRTGWGRRTRSWTAAAWREEWRAVRCRVVLCYWKQSNIEHDARVTRMTSERCTARSDTRTTRHVVATNPNGHTVYLSPRYCTTEYVLIVIYIVANERTYMYLQVWS